MVFAESVRGAGWNATAMAIFTYDPMEVATKLQNDCNGRGWGGPGQAGLVGESRHDEVKEGFDAENGMRGAW